MNFFFFGLCNDAADSVLSRTGWRNTLKFYLCDFWFLYSISIVSSLVLLQVQESECFWNQGQQPTQPTRGTTCTYQASSSQKEKRTAPMLVSSVCKRRYFLLVTMVFQDLSIKTKGKIKMP